MRRDTADYTPKGTGSAVNRVSARDKPGDVVGRLRDHGDVEEVEVVVAHRERATLRVGDVYLKIDPGQRRTDVEVGAMAVAPVPTPEVLWHKPPVLALAALPRAALGRLGEPSDASSAAWAAAGAAPRKLNGAPLPPWPGPSLDDLTSNLARECDWLVKNGVLPPDVVVRNRCVAEAALRHWTPSFTHGDLKLTHVFVDGDDITGVIDWSEACQGDALFDLAILTFGHEEHLGDVVAGYGTDVDLDVIRAWWSLRSLLAGRARLRPVRAGLRGRRAEVPDVRPYEPDGDRAGRLRSAL
ncbi:phosphotransferase [Nocardiopsis oceani]